MSETLRWEIYLDPVNGRATTLLYEGTSYLGVVVEHADGTYTWGPAYVADTREEAIDSLLKETTATKGLSFGKALEALKAGHKVARKGWNGKNMWVALTEGSEVPSGAPLRGALEALAEEVASRPDGDRRSFKVNAHVDMRAADGSLVIGWLASQTDMLAEDWEVVA